MPRAGLWSSWRPQSATKHLRSLLSHRVPLFRLVRRRPKLGELPDIEPLHAAAYIEAMQRDYEKPTVKRQLAAKALTPTPA